MKRTLFFLCVSLAVRMAYATTFYVSGDGDDGRPDAGTSWENPYRNIQTAVEAAADGDTVLVGDGTYFYTPHADEYSVVTLEKGVEVRSVNGPSRTFIDARTWTPDGKIDNNRAMRAALIAHESAVLSGFTLTNGTYNPRASTSSGFSKFFCSGAKGTAGVLTNCTIHLRTVWAGRFLELEGTARATDIRFHRLTPDNIKELVITEFSGLVSCKDSAIFENSAITDIYFRPSLAWSLISLSERGTMRNCLIARNIYGESASEANGGLIQALGYSTIENCTIADNRCLSAKGAVELRYSSSIMNSIVHGNVADLGGAEAQDIFGQSKRISHCCSPLLPEGEEGNLSCDPLFADDSYNLMRVSRCIDAGEHREWMDESSTDLTGAPRQVGTVDMGCLEYQAGDAPSKLACAFEIAMREGVAPFEATFDAYALGNTNDLTALWDFGDGTTATGWPRVSHIYQDPGLYTITLTVRNGGGDSSVFVKEDSLRVVSDTCYVSMDGGSIAPYATWETAATNLADAVAVGTPRVLVADGTYLVPSPIVLSSPVRIESVNGPEATILSTGYDKSMQGKEHCRRFFTISHEDVVVSGFTLRGGNAGTYQAPPYFTAVVEMSAGLLTNCIAKEIYRLERSAAFRLTGTARVVDTVIDGSDVIVGNHDAQELCGVKLLDNARLERCRVSGFHFNCPNAALAHAAVVLEGPGVIVRNCLIHGNVNGKEAKPEANGGGVAIRNGLVENCTIVGNTAGGYGGGIFFCKDKGAVINSIVHGNRSLLNRHHDVYDEGAPGAITYSCGSDLDEVAGGLGDGCIVKDPRLLDDGSFSLSPFSPCLDTGFATEAATAPHAVDLAGQARLVGEGVDMGAFELAHPAPPAALSAVVDIKERSGVIPFECRPEATAFGDTTGLLATWDFGDGGQEIGTLAPVHAYLEPGVYTIRLVLANEAGERSETILEKVVTALPTVCYVSTNGTSVIPYATWETAATNPVDAVELMPPEILVGEGVYRASPKGIALVSPTKMHSLKGPAHTSIVGTTGGPRESQSTRLVWVRHDGAVFSGFTLAGGQGSVDFRAKAIQVDAGVARDCIVTNTLHYGHGPIVRTTGRGRLEGFRIHQGLTGWFGYKDRLYSNTVIAQENSVIDGCILEGYNMTLDKSGDANHQAALNITGNAVVRNTIVRDAMVVTNCTTHPDRYRAAVVIEGNGTLVNCTIVGNRASLNGGGVFIASKLNEHPVVRNNILWGNIAETGVGNDLYDLKSPEAPRVTFSCLSDETLAGQGNLHVDPLFEDGSLRLSLASPCINAGTNAPWMADALDFTGAPRVRNRLVDFGAIERALPGGLLLRIR